MATFDRRRTNPPPGGTTAPVFDPSLLSSQQPLPTRTRPAQEVRKIFLKTNLTPSAPGSAYLELAPSSGQSGTLKVSTSVHGPRPLPRSAAYSSTLVLSCTVKYAPFAARQRRGYLRDATERDLSAQVEGALRAAVLGVRWPKSGADVVLTVLEGSEERSGADGATLGDGSFARMVVLAHAISAAGAALAGAGIDSVDLVAGGVAALVRTDEDFSLKNYEVLLDPDFAEHPPSTIVAACAVAYLPARDEIAGLWVLGEVPLADDPKEDGTRDEHWERLLDGAIQAASRAGLVVRAAVSGEA